MLIRADETVRGAHECETPHHSSESALLDHALLDLDQPLVDAAVEAIAETFKILGDPTRIRILHALSAGERCVCEIAGLVRMSESAVSHQLRLLRGMRLVRPRRAGRQVFYALDDQHIVELLRLAVTHVQEPGAELAVSVPASAP